MLICNPGTLEMKMKACLGYTVIPRINKDKKERKILQIVCWLSKSKHKRMIFLSSNKAIKCKDN